MSTIFPAIFQRIVAPSSFNWTKAYMMPLSWYRIILLRPSIRNGSFKISRYALIKSFSHSTQYERASSSFTMLSNRFSEETLSSLRGLKTAPPLIVPIWLDISRAYWLLSCASQFMVLRYCLLGIISAMHSKLFFSFIRTSSRCKSFSSTKGGLL
jgi:hypothetical protein